MRLTTAQGYLLLEKHGCYVTEACDKCGQQYALHLVPWLVIGLHFGPFKGLIKSSHEGPPQCK